MYFVYSTKCKAMYPLLGSTFNFISLASQQIRVSKWFHAVCVWIPPWAKNLDYQYKWLLWLQESSYVMLSISVAHVRRVVSHVYKDCNYISDYHIYIYISTFAQFSSRQSQIIPHGCLFWAMFLPLSAMWSMSYPWTSLWVRTRQEATSSMSYWD